MTLAVSDPDAKLAAIYSELTATYDEAANLAMSAVYLYASLDGLITSLNAELTAAPARSLQEKTYKKIAESELDGKEYVTSTAKDVKELVAKFDSGIGVFQKRALSSEQELKLTDLKAKRIELVALDTLLSAPDGYIYSSSVNQTWANLETFKSTIASYTWAEPQEYTEDNLRDVIKNVSKMEAEVRLLTEIVSNIASERLRVDVTKYKNKHEEYRILYNRVVDRLDAAWIHTSSEGEKAVFHAQLALLKEKTEGKYDVKLHLDKLKTAIESIHASWFGYGDITEAIRQISLLVEKIHRMQLVENIDQTTAELKEAATLAKSFMESFSGPDTKDEIKAEFLATMQSVRELSQGAKATNDQIKSILADPARTAEVSAILDNVKNMLNMFMVG